METLLIINPYSQNGKSGLLARRVMNYLSEKDYPFGYAEIKKFDDAYHYSVDANRSGIKNIIAVGGDGTINKVLNGFYDNYGNKISDSRFGAIHTGMSPDLCKNYNIPTNYIEAVETIIAQNITHIPVGLIRLQNSSTGSEPETKYFACCANIGLGAALARSAGSGIRAQLGDFAGTLISFLKILLTYKGTDYSVRINNKPSELKNIFNISVGMTSYIASGLKVYRDESIPDDQFYILKTGNIKLWNIPGLLKKLYSGKKFTNASYLALDYASCIEILSNAIHPEVEFDGDPAGFLPCTIEIAKDRLPVLTNQRV